MKKSGADETGRNDFGEVDLGRLNGNLGFRLKRVHQRLSRKFAERTKPFDLHSGGISALAIIEANPGISQIAIAREIDVDASIAVGLLNDLRRRSLIARGRLPDDRRRYAIELTEEGRAFLDDAFSVVVEMEDDLLSFLSPTELVFLGRLLDRLYGQLNNAQDDEVG